MASKFTYEIGLDTKGYVDGVKQGKDANADFSTSIKKVKDNLPNLKKELNASRKEAMGLALAYSKLSESEKQSGFGKALARELEEAKKRTAELVDMTGDLQNEFKNLASDTATWDAMKEGIGIAKDVATGFIGTIATLSGKEKELQPLIAKIAAVQGLANSAISIGNALQKQSSIMLGIRRVQEAALAKAIALETTATNGATVAQRAFNAVAKANPYVLLASAIIAVGAAIGGYILATRNATSETEKLKAEMHDASTQAQKDAVEETTKLDILYNATQNHRLSIEDRKKAVDKLIEQYPGYFRNLTQEEILVGKASAAYKQLKDDIIAVAMARAYEKKIQERAEKLVELKEQEKQQQEELNRLEQKSKNANSDYKPYSINVASSNAGLNVHNAKEDLAETQKAIKVNEDAISSYQDEINKTSTAQDRLSRGSKTYRENLEANVKSIQRQLDNLDPKLPDFSKQVTKLRSNLKTAEKALKDYDKSIGRSEDKTTTKTTPKTTTPKTTHKVDASGNVVKVNVDKEVQAATNSIEDLEKQVSDLQSNLRKGLVPQDAVQITIERIKNLQDKIKTLKIQYGFEEPEKAKTKLEELQDNLAKHQKAYILAVDTNDEQAKQAALKAYYEAQKELDEYQLSIKIEPLPDPKEIAKQKNEVQKIVDETLNPKVKMEYDFSALQGKDKDVTFNAANKALADLKRVEEARDRLQEIMDNPSSSDAQISTAQQGLETLHDLWQQLTTDVNLYKEANKELETVQKKNEDVAKGVQSIGQAVQATSSLFSALGEASDNEGMKAAGIVAQAVATIALSFAEAMRSASKNWVTWLTFGVTGLATMITMISQVKQATSGGYAQGGVIPGSSYTGDRLMINANSGERVLTANQNKNFERLVNMLDHNKINSIGAPSNVYVTGKIQGKDLLLVQRNANKVMHKSGQSINI